MSGVWELWALCLWAGVLSFLSPCVLPLAPAFVAALAVPAKGLGGWRARWAASLAFAAGACAPFVAAALWAGSQPGLAQNKPLFAAAGLAAIALGLKRAIRPPDCHRPGPSARRWARLASGGGLEAPLRALGLGLAGSFGWTLCSAPVVAAILALASGRSGAAGAGALLAAYCLGAAGPLVVLSLAAHPLSRRLEAVERLRLPLVRLGGLAMAGLGVWLAWVNKPW
jgi:cytochrome c-type biogenesis protein